MRRLPRLERRLDSMACLSLAVFIASFGLSLDRRSIFGDEKPNDALLATKTPLPTSAQIELFERKIRPLLVERCFECHSSESQEGGLRVDSLAALLKGGERGPALIPGDPKNSLLIRAVGHGETLQMPPKQKLPAARIAELAEWVRQGAPWPDQPLAKIETKAVAGGRSATPLMRFTAEQRTHWALQPIALRPAPLVQHRDWLQSPLDAWILAPLETAGIGPSPAAIRSVLLRRLTFDLNGLPPTPEEVAEFVANDSPDALSRAVDRLLASPRYGERYGRHWLDLARYADSNGLDENLAYANAFRYRDYVIAAFNRDKPYDRFVQEQLAGDLLPHANADSEREGLVATGFLSLGAKMLAEDDPVKMQMDIIDEQIDTLGKCFLGLTLGCARCHDHKFDPIDSHDYYALAGIFKSTRTMVNHNVVAVWRERPIADAETIARRDKLRAEANSKRAEAAKAADQAAREFLDRERLRATDYLREATARLVRQDLLATAKPHGDLPEERRQQIPGLILREAENFDRGNVTKDTTSYGFGIGVLVNGGKSPNFVEYDIEIPKAGPYRVELRYAAQDGRPCRLTIYSGKERSGKERKANVVLPAVAGQVTGSWQPDGQRWFVEGIADLPAGRVTLRLEHPQFFPHIDKWLLAPALADDPTLTAFTTNTAATNTAATNTAATSAATASAANASAAATDDSPPLDADLLTQWTAYLAKHRQDARYIDESPLGVWIALALQRDAALIKGDKARDWAKKLGVEPTSPATATATASPPLQKFDLVELAQRYRQLWRESADARRALEDAQGPFAKPKKIEQSFTEATRKQLAALRDEAVAIEKAMPAVPEAMAVADDKPTELRIHFRGSHLTLGEEVPRRFLRVVPAELAPSDSISSSGSGRLELARWITRPAHPLTPRVIANRVWLWHFGLALARSPDNFGLLGEKPTHPELLDWLAAELPRRDWSLKSLHREIALSATYGMSTAYREAADAADPENRLLWRVPRRRLSAEEIRDSLLAVSNRMDRRMGGTYLPTPNRQYVTSTANVNPAIYDLTARSVYVPVVRSALYEVFPAFDFADPSVLAGQRDATTVAPQALFMMNSKLTAEASQGVAEQLLAIPNVDDNERITRLFELAYARLPRTGERERVTAFLERYLEATRAADDGVTQTGAPQANARNATEARRLPAWRALTRAVLAANEFIYLD